MAAQEEVEVGGVADGAVDHGPRDNVPAAVRHAVRGVQPRVMPLLHHDECHGGLVVRFDVRTRLADRVQLVQQNLQARGARVRGRAGRPESQEGGKNPRMRRQHSKIGPSYSSTWFAVRQL